MSGRFVAWVLSLVVFLIVFIVEVFVHAAFPHEVAWVALGLALFVLGCLLPGGSPLTV